MCARPPKKPKKTKWAVATETGRSSPGPASVAAAAAGAAASATSPSTSTADALPPIDHGSAAQQLNIQIEETEALYRRSPTGMCERLFSQLNSLYLQQACHARSMVRSGRPSLFQPTSGAATSPNPLTVKLAKAVTARIGSGSDSAAAADGRKGAGALPGAGVSDAAGESRVKQTWAPGVHFRALKKLARADEEIAH